MPLNLAFILLTFYVLITIDSQEAEKILQSPMNLPRMASFMTIIQYQNQQINIGIVTSPKLKTSLSFHQFLHGLICVDMCVRTHMCVCVEGGSIKFDNMNRFV